MRMQFLLPCLVAILALAPAGAAIQPAGQSDPAAPAPAEPAPAPAPPSAPAEAEPADPVVTQPEAGPVEQQDLADQPESVRAITSLDLRRLETDRAYAESIVRHLDALPALAENAENAGRGRYWLDNLRMYALITAGRPREARPLLDRSLALQPIEAGDYALLWFGALRLNDPERAVAVVEQASRNVRSREWPQLREMLEQQHVWTLMREFPGEAGRPRRARLAEALFRIGWPGHDDPEASDGLRMMMLDEQLARSDLSDATDLAAGITTTGETLSLITLKRYDPIVGARDRLAMLARAVGEQDRATAAAVEAAPENLRKLLDRAQFLRGQGRERDALALLEPLTRDVPATVARADEGMWVVNEAAYALLSLGRNDEAVALTAALAALPIAERPDLIGPSINHSVVLLRAGRNDEALAHATRLDRDFAQHANEFGRMWMAASAVCALERLGRRSETAPWLRRLRDGREANGAALTRAYLCLNDLDAAEALVLRRLRGSDSEALVRAFQDFQLASAVPEDPVATRFAALRERPAVRAAIERIGRILPLPMARAYWGAT